MVVGRPPTIGQHNIEILMGLLGVERDELSQLEAGGVIETASPCNEGSSRVSDLSQSASVRSAGSAVIRTARSGALRRSETS